MENKKKILIIEDHDSIRMLLGNFLKKEYSVLTAKDGFEGLSLLSKGNVPDLIILDLEMPRISGFEFLNNIRGSGFFKNIPVIIVSGEENQELQNRCYAYDVAGFFLKPFNPLKLKLQVQTTLNGAQGALGRSA